MGPNRPKSWLRCSISPQWRKLAAIDICETIPIGLMSPLREDDAHYYVMEVLQRSAKRLKVATVGTGAKHPCRFGWLLDKSSIWARSTAPLPSIAPSTNIRLGRRVLPTTLGQPPIRRLVGALTAVWTGNEMINWGAGWSVGDTDTGGRYNPTTDDWTLITTTNAPSPRSDHTAVWTGSEMIIWGSNDGFSGMNTGGKI